MSVVSTQRQGSNWRATRAHTASSGPMHTHGKARIMWPLPLSASSIAQLECAAKKVSEDGTRCLERKPWQLCHATQHPCMSRTACMRTPCAHLVERRQVVKVGRGQLHGVEVVPASAPSWPARASVRPPIPCRPPAPAARPAVWRVVVAAGVVVMAHRPAVCWVLQEVLKQNSSLSSVGLGYTS